MTMTMTGYPDSDQPPRKLADDGDRAGTVLVVEDNASVRTMIRLCCLAHGFTIVEAANGALGVQIAASARLDLILMDLNLPALDGLETTRQIRALPGRPASVPIVGITAADHDTRRAACLAVGMNDLISKVDLIPSIPTLLSRFVGTAVTFDTPSPSPTRAEPTGMGATLGVAELNLRRDLIGQAAMAETFARFSAQGPQLLSNLDSAWRAGRYADAAAAAHSLGGGAATFQLIRLSSILSRLDVALRRPSVNDDEVSKLLGVLADAWADALTSFERWLAADAPPDGTEPSGSL